MRTIGWLSVLFLGCRDDDDLGALADQAGADLADLTAQVEAAASEAAASTARAATGTCAAAPAGTCAYCVEVDGGPLAGTFVLGLESAPCGASYDDGERSATYSVEASTLDGTYDGTLAGDYAFSATGERQATLEVGPARGDAVTGDASFTIDELTATTVGTEVQSASLALTYVGYGGHTWALEAEGDRESVSGTLTADNGSSCTIAGAWDAPELSCDF